MSQSTQKKKKRLKHKNIWESKAGLKGSYIKTQKQKKKVFFFFFVFFGFTWILEVAGKLWVLVFRLGERERERLNRIQTDRKGTNENWALVPSKAKLDTQSAILRRVWFWVTYAVYIWTLHKLYKLSPKLSNKLKNKVISFRFLSGKLWLV